MREQIPPTPHDQTGGHPGDGGVFPITSPAHGKLSEPQPLPRRTKNKTREQKKRERKRWRANRLKREVPRSTDLTVCRSCNFLLDPALFFADKTRPNGLAKRCRNCFSARLLGSKRAPHVRARTKRREVTKRYGITPADYDRMLDEQGGKCAICRETPGEGRALAIDHCHTTGHVRGLLCFRCNSSIGFLEDSPSRVKATLAYLKRHQQLAFPKEKAA